MTNKTPMNTKAGTLTLSAFAVAAALLFGPCLAPGAASAADYRHGEVKDRHAYGCKDLPHFRDVHDAFKKSKKEGQAELDRNIAAGNCKMLQAHARTEVKSSRSDLSALHVQIDGESGELWIETHYFKHN